MITQSKAIHVGPYRHQLNWFDGARSIIVQSATAESAHKALSATLQEPRA